MDDGGQMVGTTDSAAALNQGEVIALFAQAADAREASGKARDRSARLRLASLQLAAVAKPRAVTPRRFPGNAIAFAQAAADETQAALAGLRKRRSNLQETA